jgi:hypothetical protein
MKTESSRIILNNINIDFAGFLPPLLVRSLLMETQHRLAFDATLWNLKLMVSVLLQNQLLEVIMDAKIAIGGYSLSNPQAATI